MPVVPHRLDFTWPLLSHRLPHLLPPFILCLFISKGKRVEYLGETRREKLQQLKTNDHPFRRWCFDSSQTIFRSSHSSAPSGGKLAFSLKQKSKLVVPSVKLSEDNDEDDAGTDNGSDGVYVKRQKLGQSEASVVSSRKFDVGNACLYTHISILVYTLFNDWVLSIIFHLCM